MKRVFVIVVVRRIRLRTCSRLRRKEEMDSYYDVV